MKFDNRLVVLGFLIPLIGIVIGHYVMITNEIKGRSIRKGSAISSLLVVIAVFVWSLMIILK